MAHQKTKTSSWPANADDERIASSLLVALEHVRTIYHNYFTGAAGYNKDWVVCLGPVEYL